jgi:hypothetical protein
MDFKGRLHKALNEDSDPKSNLLDILNKGRYSAGGFEEDEQPWMVDSDGNEVRTVGAFAVGQTNMGPRVEEGRTHMKEPVADNPLDNWEDTFDSGETCSVEFIYRSQAIWVQFTPGRGWSE